MVKKKELCNCLILRILSLVLLVLVSVPCYPQGFSGLYQDLDQLDTELGLIEQSTNRQFLMLKDLEQKLKGSEQSVQDLLSISQAQGEYVRSLLEKLRQLELVRQEQLKYQKRLGRNLFYWKIGTISLGVISVASVTTVVVLLTRLSS